MRFYKLSGYYVIILTLFLSLERAQYSDRSDNTCGNLRSNETPQYDVMSSTTPGEHETGVYLTIPDNALSQPYSGKRSGSAIKRAEFADKLTSMTDEDFRRQFKVTDDFMLC